MKKQTEIIIGQAQKVSINFEEGPVQLPLVKREEDFIKFMLVVDDAFLSGQFMIRMNGIKSERAHPILEVSLHSSGGQDRSIQVGSMSLYGIESASMKSFRDDAPGMDQVFVLEKEELDGFRFWDELFVKIEARRNVPVRAVLEIERLDLVFLY